MEITVRRIANRPNYCIGRLYIDGQAVCDTLEDTDRGLDDSMTEKQIARMKVYGKTAIPTGRYRVLMTYSPRFKKILPELVGVKGYSGIRIHSGNKPEDTLGCILVGINSKVGMVLESRKTFDRVMDIIKGQRKLFITVERVF